MSARKEPKRAAFLIPVETYVNAKGEERTRAAIGGDEEVAGKLIDFLKENADAHLETPEETGRARMFSGFGKGKMDANQGRRTRIVKPRRGGGGFSTAA